MAHEKNNPTMFDRLRRSNTARAALLLAGLAVAGCASTKTSNETRGAVASVASRQDWCKATSTIIGRAFGDGNAASECEVMPQSSTPGTDLINWTLNAAGVEGFSVSVSVMNIPFKQFIGHAKPVSGYGTEYVEIPNSTEMYVKMANSKQTGVLDVLSGQGGEIPSGAQASMGKSAGIFDVFGSLPIASLYPPGASE